GRVLSETGRGVSLGGVHVMRRHTAGFQPAAPHLDMGRTVHIRAYEPAMYGARMPRRLGGYVARCMQTTSSLSLEAWSGMAGLLGGVRDAARHPASRRCPPGS